MDERELLLASKLYWTHKLHKFQFFCSALVMSSSLPIKFHELYCSISMYILVLTTDPGLNVIGCRVRKFYVKPQW